MTRLVLDASVAVKWYVNEAGTERALALLDDPRLELFAADIFRIEVVNALLRQLKVGQISDSAFEDAVTDLALTTPRLVPSTEILDRAVDLARALAHPLYDCLYLASAERREAVMVTADAAFVQRCRSQLGHDPVVGRLRLLSDVEP
ncbi:MAG TPA: type II toxin-antitoxin system VapC family toxin [Microvirga sp.]|jgi:predicted nucleic acid-binding protein|nr:type II toxin-antitoxin system VapC family toxin [Microvirga sp.]